MSDTEKTKQALVEIITHPVAYYVAFAKAGGGVTVGVFLSQLFYWTGKGSDPDGWIYKTQEEWEAETGLTRWEQETARKRLKRAGVLEEKRRGVPARLHYRVDLDTLIDLVSSLWENHNQECGKTSDKNVGKPQTSMLETNKLIHRLPETTAENRCIEAAGPSAICSIHHTAMERHQKDGQNWYSHKLADGTWCKGAAGDVSRADPHATDRQRYAAWNGDEQ